MSTVNQASLRDEFARLKDEYRALAAAGKVPAETGVLMNAVFVLLELMVAIFLEKTTRKGSGNSSIPSSQNTTADDSAATSAPGTKPKGPGGQGQRFAGSRTVETETVASVTTCGCCGQDLSDVAAHAHERRTRIDIVFEKTVEHVDAEIKTCPACTKTTKGEFAADLMGPVQYGLGVKAWVVNLLVSQMVSLNRAAKLVHSMLGQLMSEATMLRHVMELHVALTRWEEATVEALLAAPVIHLDETSMRVDGKNHWVHVVSAGDRVLKQLHPNRGLEAMRAHDIFAGRGGGQSRRARGAGPRARRTACQESEARPALRRSPTDPMSVRSGTSGARIAAQLASQHGAYRLVLDGKSYRVPRGDAASPRAPSGKGSRRAVADGSETAE